MSWWELLAFYESSGPTSRVCAVEAPERFGWTVEAIVTARGLGVDIPWIDGKGNAPRATGTRTVHAIGTGVDRAELDEWFYPART